MKRAEEEDFGTFWVLKMVFGAQATLDRSMRVTKACWRGLCALVVGDQGGVQDTGGLGGLLCRDGQADGGPGAL